MVYLEEPSVDPLRNKLSSFTIPFLPELMFGRYALSVAVIAPSACLRISFVDLGGPSIDLRGP